MLRNIDDFFLFWNKMNVKNSLMEHLLLAQITQTPTFGSLEQTYQKELSKI